MFDNGENSVAVKFQIPSALAARTAAVVGEFNSWDPTANAMDAQDDGTFTAVVHLPAGRTYQFRYLIDGQRWENDWNADSYAVNIFGGDDSVVDLTEGSSRLTTPIGEATASSAPAPQLHDERQP